MLSILKFCKKGNVCCTGYKELNQSIVSACGWEEMFASGDKVEAG
jgi:hypothetical protein